MIESDNETVADIVAMLRRFVKGEELPTDEIPSFTSLADRLEEAHKRGVAELRECLEQAYGDKLGTYTMKGNEVQRWRKALEG